MAKRRPIDEIIKDASKYDKLSNPNHSEHTGLIYANDKANHDDVSDYGFTVTIDADNYLDSVKRIESQIKKSNERCKEASKMVDDIVGAKSDSKPLYLSSSRDESSVTVMGFDNANSAATYGCSVGNQILENMNDFDHWTCHDDEDEAHIADVFNTDGKKTMTLNLVYDYERQGQHVHAYAEQEPELKSATYTSLHERLRDFPVIEPDDEPGYEPGYEV